MWDTKNDRERAYRSIPRPGHVVEALREWLECNLDEKGRLRSPVFVSLKRLADVARPMEARSEWYKPGTTNLINNLADGFKQIRRGAGLVKPNSGAVHCLRDTYTYRLKKMG